MGNEKILESFYKISASTFLLENNKEVVKELNEKLLEEFSSGEKVVEIIGFMYSQVIERTDEYEEFKKEKGMKDYIEGIKEMKKYMDMAKGYQEMADINLSISEESHHLEGETTNYEMGAEETTSNNQAG